ncbi:nucleoside-diphosphate kinase [Fodinicola acaciae]|uniref:nucleoside-diphosphate kinase n=1 Tax=Fodinicola acaciae TaxID=2681555 RepID=UPI0013D32913|nr:nucleoside-diphosphate kinase [Fodinicola acaciae]
MERKRELFDDDTYYLECWDDFRDALAPARLREFCEHHSFLLVKPEALLTGRLPAILSWLRARGWLVAAVRDVPYCRHVLRGLWRYHWNAVSRQHREVVDLLFRACPALLLVVRHAKAGATAALAAQKGPSKPARRRPGELRAELGAYNAYLNFVHSPDEPADLVRELGVLLPSASRAALIDEATRGASVAVPSPDAALDWHALDRKNAADRLMRLTASTDAIASCDDWLALRATLPANVTEDFAFAVFASYLTTAEVDGRTRRIPTIRDGSVET